MKDEETKGRAGVGEMHKRRATLEDGRYLIYYTFGDETCATQSADEDARKREPEAAPPTEEDRRV